MIYASVFVVMGLRLFVMILHFAVLALGKIFGIWKEGSGMTGVWRFGGKIFLLPL